MTTFRKLRSKRVGERIEGEVELQAMGPIAVDGLLTIIRQEEKKRRTRRNIYFALAGAFCLFGLPATAYCVFMMLTSTQAGAAGMYSGALSGILGGGGGGILGGFSWLLVPTADQVTASSALGRLEDKRAAGPLLTALQSGMLEPTMRTSAGLAILRISHKLTEDDEMLVNATEREHLNQAIKGANPTREHDFLSALLLLAAKVGDVRTLEVVQGVSWKAPNNERTIRLRDTANQTALRIQERIGRNRASETLLRPATSALSLSENLLRPAGTSVPTESSELLRASNSNSASA